MEEELKAIAIKMANEEGLINLTRKKLCERAKIKDGSFHAIARCSFTELIDSIRPMCTNKGTNTYKGRANKDTRIDNILDIALDLCDEVGLYNVTRIELADRCGISPSLIGHHFGTMVKLRRQIIRKAIVTERLSVIAQGIALNDPHAKKAPEELKTRALASLATA